MTRQFNSPTTGSPSTVGSQLRNEYYQKQALIEARKEQYFSQLADVTAMPKNMGKKIKQYQYIPLLDKGNTNDQGIDAAGALMTSTQWTAWNAAGTEVGKAYANEAAAITAAGVNGRVLQNYGNLYGSSKDIGTINGKMPALSETGGRVNRVGFKRKELEGSLEKFGFFDEYTQESMDFDTDDQLMEHINREMINGANEMTEDALQIDLLTYGTTTRYAGAATQNSEVVAASTVTYGDLMRLSIDLDNNRTPKHTKVITGTRMIDTRVIPASRVMYIGSELLPTLKKMKDLHNNPAFISVEKYAANGTTVTGEVGAIDQFRIVVVPEMLKWAGAGGDASATATHYETNTRYDVFPMLVVGDGSFTTIGFQTDGKTVKFKITHKAPGEATADRNDPYGETGFMSIKWYYGFMALRPERIGLIKTAAEL